MVSNIFDMICSQASTSDTLLWASFLEVLGAMAPKGSKHAAPETKESKAAAKKAKMEAEKQEAEAIKASEQRKAEQRLLAATCCKPTATPEQKAMHAEYKSLSHFSKEKELLLQKFLKDKKCGWYQGLEQTKSESTSQVTGGLKGYGTRYTYQFMLFLQRKCGLCLQT